MPRRFILPGLFPGPPAIPIACSGDGARIAPTVSELIVESASFFVGMTPYSALSGEQSIWAANVSVTLPSVSSLQTIASGEAKDSSPVPTESRQAPRTTFAWPALITNRVRVLSMGL